MLKPFEVYGKKFDKSFRGYDEQKVDTFLLQVANDFEAIYEEKIQLKEDVEIANNKLEHYQQLEKTMQNTLMIAQATAEEIKTKAEKESEVIISQAQEKASHILDNIEKNARNRKDELGREIEDKQRELAYVQTNIQTCLDKMRGLLENQLRIIGDDDFVKEITNIAVNVELLKPKAEQVEETIVEEEDQEIADAKQLEVDSQAEEVTDNIEEAQEENKGE